ncbi:MAG: septal ring lytic transglycosylase RlpA family protein [Halomonas subglaciescola]|nr:septal ring lytic transglycosylase RlpA family protein [Halomonas subglaciescola]
MRHRRRTAWPDAISRTLLSTCALLTLAGCASQSAQPPPDEAPATQTEADKAPAASDKASGGGRYAMNADAYPLDPPDLSRVPDATPRTEPLSKAGNRSTYTVWGKKYRVLPDAKGYSKTGTASWYGKKFHGYATSSGEIYDMYEMSAAHRSLPLPTFARVTREGTHKSVIVRINDRGPFHSEREIDLSYAAASKLGLTDHGTGRVKVEAIDPEQWAAQQGKGGATPPSNKPPQAASKPQAPAAAPANKAPAASGDGVYWQVAALESEQGAAKLKRRLAGELDQPVRVAEDAGVYRVQVGPVAPGADDAALRDSLRNAGFPQAFIVR